MQQAGRMHARLGPAPDDACMPATHQLHACMPLTSTHPRTPPPCPTGTPAYLTATPCARRRERAEPRSHWLKGVPAPGIYIYMPTSCCCSS